MNKNDTVAELSGRDQFTDALTDLLSSGVRQLIEQAVEAELAEFIKLFANQVLDNGRAAVVRNGDQPAREIQTGIGPVTVKIPKVRAKNGEAVTFRSALVPPYIRKTRSLAAALPWLYLKGISTGEMASALEVLVGPDAKGLSASTIARLKQQWAEDYQQGRSRSDPPAPRRTRSLRHRRSGGSMSSRAHLERSRRPARSARGFRRRR